MEEITRDDIEKLYTIINKKHPSKSIKAVKKEIKKYSEAKKINIENVVNSILAYENGMLQSIQTNTEIAIVYSLIVAIVTIIITILTATNIIDDEVKVGYCGIFVIALMVGIILLIGLSIFKIRKSFKHGFLVNVLENWSYEETKEELAKETEKNVLPKSDEDGFIEYTVRVKKVNENQPSN